MLIVGELINASRKAVAPAIENKDASAIADLAEKQSEHCADYIDVNAGMFADKEGEYLQWIVGTVQQKQACPVALTARVRRPSRRPWRFTKGPPWSIRFPLKRSAMMRFYR